MIGKGARPDLSGRRPKPHGPNDTTLRDPEQVKACAKAILESVGLTRERVLGIRMITEGLGPIVDLNARLLCQKA